MMESEIALTSFFNFCTLSPTAQLVKVSLYCYTMQQSTGHVQVMKKIKNLAHQVQL